MPLLVKQVEPSVFTLRVWLCCSCVQVEACHQLFVNTLQNICAVVESSSRNEPVGFSPPLVWLCRVWVDADGFVTVSYGCIGFLHLDVDTDSKRTQPFRESLSLLNSTPFNASHECEDSYGCGALTLSNE